MRMLKEGQTESSLRRHKERSIISGCDLINKTQFSCSEGERSIPAIDPLSIEEVEEVPKILEKSSGLTLKAWLVIIKVTLRLVVGNESKIYGEVMLDFKQGYEGFTLYWIHIIWFYYFFIFFIRNWNSPEFPIHFIASNHFGRNFYPLFTFHGPSVLD